MSSSNVVRENYGHMTATAEERTDGIAATVSLKPIAAPSILGLYGFAGSTFIVAANLAHWYGTTSSPLFLFPFAVFFGGLAQFLAGMWSYTARDALATAMHGMWGAFWMGYGLLFTLIAVKAVTPPTGAFPELGYWFIALAAITWIGVWAAAGVARALFWVLLTLAAGATVMAIGQLAGSDPITTIAGYLFLISALLAWYTASALMLNATYGRTVLPLGLSSRMKQAPKVATGAGEPGVIRGQ